MGLLDGAPRIPSGTKPRYVPPVDGSSALCLLPPDPYLPSSSPFRRKPWPCAMQKGDGEWDAQRHTVWCEFYPVRKRTSRRPLVTVPRLKVRWAEFKVFYLSYLLAPREVAPRKQESILIARRPPRRRTAVLFFLLPHRHFCPLLPCFSPVPSTSLGKHIWRESNIVIAYMPVLASAV